MEQIYKEDTLLHSVGFNLQRFESVLNYGILSRNKAKEMGIQFSKNYDIKNQDDDYISLVAVKNIIPEDDISAYKLHTVFGINFIIEGVDYEEDVDKLFIHRQDEVLVKDFIPRDKIIGVAIPSEYEDTFLFDLVIIPPDVTTYKYISDISINYLNFLKRHGSSIEMETLLIYLREIYLINKALYRIKNEDNDIDKKELIQDHEDTLKELNEFLSEETFICFSKILGKDVNLKKVVQYLSNNLLSIYNIPFGYEKRSRKS